MSECSPELFLYTDAHFGHAGGTGFQFIGLPRDPKARSFSSEIEQYLRIKLPTEMQIAAETGQKVLLPVSMRILPLAIQGRTLISRTVPVGQVYRAEGTRGKPGNILAQALLFPAATNMDEVMSCAYLMPWASELDRKTHLDEKALDYPPFTVELPTGFLDVELKSSSEDLNALLSAVLERLDGGPPVLLRDTHHDEALAMFVVIASQLPDQVVERLSWSTYEFDGRGGFDVAATRDGTQLDGAHGAYRVPGSEAMAATYRYAASKIEELGLDFWERLNLHSNVLGGPAAGSIASTVDILQSLEDMDVLDLEFLTDTLERLSAHEATPARRGEAIRIFRLALEGAPWASRLEKLVRLHDVALRLDTWSGDAEFSQSVYQKAETIEAVVAMFRDDATPSLLVHEIQSALDGGGPPNTVLGMCFLAADPEITRGRGVHAFSQAVHTAVSAHMRAIGREFLDRAQLQVLLKKASRHPVLEQLVLLEMATTNAEWYERLVSVISELAPGNWETVLARLDAGVVGLMDPTEPAGSRVLTARLRSHKAEFWNESEIDLDVDDLLSRLDRGIVGFAREDREGAAFDVATTVLHFERLSRGAPNSFAMLGAVDRLDLPAEKDWEEFQRPLRDNVPTEIYLPYVLRVWTTLAPLTLERAERLWESLVRKDVMAPLSKHVVGDLTMRPEVDPKDGISRVFSEAMLRLDSGKASPAWFNVLEKTVIRIGTRMSEEAFRSARGNSFTVTNPIIEEILNRRNNRIGARIAKVGKRLFSGLKRGHRGRGVAGEDETVDKD